MPISEVFNIEQIFSLNCVILAPRAVGPWGSCQPNSTKSDAGTLCGNRRPRGFKGPRTSASLVIFSLRRLQRMIREGTPPALSQIASPKRIWILSLLAGGVVCTTALVFQWAVSDDWMHWTGLLGIAGSILAGVIASTFVAHRQSVLRRKRIELLRRIESLPQMYDRLRNAL